MVYGSQLEKAKIQQCDELGNASGKHVDFQFNPETLKFGFTNQLSNDPKTKQEPEHRGPVTTSVLARLEASHGSQSSNKSDFVANEVALFQELATPRISDGEPSRLELKPVVLQWGNFWSAVSLISGLEIEFNMFDVKGNALSAEVSIQLTEFDPASTARSNKLPLQNPTSFTPLPQTLITVQAGQNLQSISEEAYGSPAHWRVVAKANGLTDPFEDLKGRKLVIPNREVLDGSG